MLYYVIMCRTEPTLRGLLVLHYLYYFYFFFSRPLFDLKYCIKNNTKYILILRVEQFQVLNLYYTIPQQPINRLVFFVGIPDILLFYLTLICVFLLCQLYFFYCCVKSNGLFNIPNCILMANLIQIYAQILLFYLFIGLSEN